MRLLVASDSHRATGNLLDIVELHLEDSDVLLFSATARMIWKCAYALPRSAYFASGRELRLGQ